MAGEGSILIPVIRVIPHLVAVGLIWRYRSGRVAMARFLIVGIVFCAAGDAVLNREGGFVPGLALFLVGHLCFIGAFLTGRPPLKPLLALPFYAYAAAMFFGLREGFGNLAVPVALYAATIATMGWRAAARVGWDRERSAGIGLAGALIFMASDSMIAFERFGGSELPLRVPIIATYWISLIGIALSVRRR